MRSVTLTGAAQQIVLAAPVVNYRGFSIKETTGTTVAAIVVWDSTATLGATGKILDEVNFLANESARELYDPPKQALIGVYVQIVGGAVAGSIFFD